jgi:hypothetical protein
MDFTARNILFMVMNFVSSKRNKIKSSIGIKAKRSSIHPLTSEYNNLSVKETTKRVRFSSFKMLSHKKNIDEGQDTFLENSELENQYCLL